MSRQNEEKIVKHRYTTLTGFLALFALIAIVVAAGSSRVSLAQDSAQGNSRARTVEQLPRPSPTPPKKEDDITLNSDDVEVVRGSARDYCPGCLEPVTRVRSLPPQQSQSRRKARGVQQVLYLYSSLSVLHYLFFLLFIPTLHFDVTLSAMAL